MNHGLKSRDKRVGNIGHGDRNDIASRIRLVRLNASHRHIVCVNSQTIRETHRQVVEDLRDRQRMSNNEGVVQRVVKANLDQCRIFRSLGDAARRCNDTRERGCKTGRRRGGSGRHVRGGLSRLRND